MELTISRRGNACIDSPPQYLYNQGTLWLCPPGSGSRGAQGWGLCVARLEPHWLLESRLCSGFSAGRVMWIWVGNLVGTNMEAQGAH